MSIHGTVSGTGQDLVLIHGWGMPSGIWGPLAADLARGYRVHAVDLPGYGGSASCAPYTLDALVHALATELPRACHVVGWSLGALVALAWARRAPRQVRKLGLIAATPCFVQRSDWPHGIARAVLQSFAAELRDDYDGTLRRFIALQVLGDEDAAGMARMVKQAVTAGGRPDVAVLSAGLAILLESDLRGDLAAIGHDTLVVHGDRDRLAPWAAGLHLARAMPGARFERIEGAAHAPFLSRLPAVSALLSGFLDG